MANTLQDAPKTHQKTAGEIGSYTFISMVTQVFTVIAGFLTRRFLGPLDMGIWSMLQIVMNYASYSTFGVLKSSHREISVSRGSGDFLKTERVKNSAYSFTVLTAFIVGALLTVFALLRKDHLETRVFLGLLFAGSYLVVHRVSLLLITLVRAYQRFDIASRQLFYSAVINATLIAVLAYRYHFYGFLAAMALTLVFNIIFIGMSMRFNLKWSLRTDDIRILFRYGLPFLLLGFLNACVLPTIDRVMILTFMGFEALGLYSIAILASNIISHIPNAASVVFVPKLYQRYGAKQSFEDLKVSISEAAHTFSNTMPCVAGIAWFVMPFFVRLILPGYIEGIEAMRWFMLGAVIIAIEIPFSTSFATLRKQKYLYPVALASVVICFILNFYAIRSGYGLVGVAIATVSTQFFRYSATYWMLFYMNRSLKGAVKMYLELTGKIVFLILFVLGAEWMTRGSSDDLIRVFLPCILLTIVYAPSFWRVNRRYDVLKTLLANVRSAQ